MKVYVRLDKSNHANRIITFCPPPTLKQSYLFSLGYAMDGNQAYRIVPIDDLATVEADLIESLDFPIEFV